MDELKHIKKIVSENKSEIEERFNVNSLRVFGSIVRGEQSSDSDIDVLVDFTPDADLFDMAGLSSFLEEKLDREVDVVSEKGLRKELRKPVLDEAVRV